MYVATMYFYHYVYCIFIPHLFGTSTLITLLKQQRANGVECLASTVIDRRQWLAEHRQKPTCLGQLF